MEGKRLSPSEIQKIIRKIPFFDGLSKESLENAINYIVTRHHPANRVILLENDWGGSVYFIVDGWVKIRTHNADGKEVTLNIVGKGEVIGEMSALEETPRSTDVITLTPTIVSSIPASDFLALLQTDTLASLRLSQLMAKRLRQVNRRLRLREAESLCRVADILLFLAEGQGKTTQKGINIPNLPHRELASITGLARETVSRALTKLEQEGIISREADSDKICIHNLNNLEDLIH